MNYSVQTITKESLWIHVCYRKSNAVPKEMLAVRITRHLLIGTYSFKLTVCKRLSAFLFGKQIKYGAFFLEFLACNQMCFRIPRGVLLTSFSLLTRQKKSEKRSKTT